MPDNLLTKPDPEALDRFLREQAKTLREKDRPPAKKEEWQGRRSKLREAMFAAMGPFPEKDGPLEPKVIGTLKRDGYRIEKVVFQSRPDVWVTSSLYVPEKRTGEAPSAKAPAVLVVHGHWAGARRDPVVQARCAGLVKLGFVVLAVDAFGAGERYTAPARGTYHGALYGSTLWPTGHTLLGLQVYDNRRAIDYLCSREEVDPKKLGITGASGGGNQSMYAGALDERIGAVAPVCSVGTYQAYLHAACCVCEVLPGALSFAEEGDVLALIAPRALLVINATKDGFQFSVGEAKKSIERARPVFKLLAVEEELRHETFESPHDYNQAMRETMYGFMTRWLKGEGEGKPIPEPKVAVETAEDLACYPPGSRPATYLLLPAFARREAEKLVRKHNERPHEHVEDWESTAEHTRTKLRKDVLRDPPTPQKPGGEFGDAIRDKGVSTQPLLLEPESGMPMAVTLRFRTGVFGRIPACVLLHLDGREEALKHPVAAALLAKNWQISAPDLRGTGATKPAKDSVRDAPDHNSTEHALWVGRPLLGQWLVEIHHLLDWLAIQPGLNRRMFAVVGLGQAGVVALLAGGLLTQEIASVAAVDGLSSYVTGEAYGPGTRMGLLAPGILRHADVPQLAALCAPRKLQIAGAISPQGKKLEGKDVETAFSYTAKIYKLLKADDRLKVAESMKPEELVERL